jgi:serine/threonine-protein kinase
MTNSEAILASRYKIVKPLGGGFGQTFLAQDLQLPNQPACVVKQLKLQLLKPQELAIAKRLFDSEAATLHDLGVHDQIPRLFAHFEQGGEFYLVQEFIEGETLESEIGAGKKWEQIKLISGLRDILHMLAFVHSCQVIHRDIKPDNLIRRRSDRKIVLIDFGSVKAISPDSLERFIEEENQTLVLWLVP